MQYKPQFYTLVSGVGKSEFPLSAFDNALMDAKIGDYNILKVSSILPSSCTYCEEVPVGKGHLLYAAYASATIDYGKTAETAVAVAIPENPNESGVIFETTLFDEAASASELVEKMCIAAMHNRNKNIKAIETSSKKITGESNTYTACISAVVMW